MDDRKKTREEGLWWVYILRCADGTLYTGSTNNVERRLEVHNAARGAKYTRGRLPVKLVYQEVCGCRSAALKREAAIKGLRRGEKETLIKKGGEKSQAFFSAKTPSSATNEKSGDLTRRALRQRQERP